MRLASRARDSPAIYRDSDDSGICLSAFFLFPVFSLLCVYACARARARLSLLVCRCIVSTFTIMKVNLAPCLRPVYGRERVVARSRGR